MHPYGCNASFSVPQLAADQLLVFVLHLHHTGDAPDMDFRPPRLSEVEPLAELDGGLGGGAGLQGCRPQLGFVGSLPDLLLLQRNQKGSSEEDASDDESGDEEGSEGGDESGDVELKHVVLQYFMVIENTATTCSHGPHKKESQPPPKR